MPIIKRNEIELSMLNEYYYVDRSGPYPREVFRTTAEDLTAADALAKANGINIMKAAAVVGGRLLCFDTDTAIRRAILVKAHSYNWVKDGVNLPGRHELETTVLVDESKFLLNIYGRSLNEVLINHERLINRYRYNSGLTFIWKSSYGCSSRVKSLDHTAQVLGK